MVAFNSNSNNGQGRFPWYEAVMPPNDPDKTVHVRNHWRRPPRKSATGRGPRDTGENLKKRG